MKRVDGEWRNQWGTARPYSRHTKGCPAKDDKCNCPKWLYLYRIGDKPKRYALNTPSWAEARNEAADVLRAFDPEISRAREEKARKESSKFTIEDAIALWIERTRNKFGADAAIVNQYRSTFGWRDREGKAHGNFLLYVQVHNERNPTDAIESVHNVTPLFC